MEPSQFPPLQDLGRESHSCHRDSRWQWLCCWDCSGTRMDLSFSHSSHKSSKLGSERATLAFISPSQLPPFLQLPPNFFHHHALEHLRLIFFLLSPHYRNGNQAFRKKNELCKIRLGEFRPGNYLAVDTDQ